MASTWDCTKEFGEVYAKELDYLRKRRRNVDLEMGTLPGEKEGNAGTKAVAPKVGHGTVGLALSGGGIRSATFSLGVLQALVRLDLLKYADYISTVSGGGYLGCCVSSLLTANPNAGVRPAQSPSQPFPLGFTGADRERPEVQHLRNYSNYISPQHGPFKLETWRLAAWYIGALVFNLICPLATAALLLILGTWVVSLLWENAWMGLPWLAWIVIGLFLIFLIWLGVLFFFAREKGKRDSMVRRAAYAAASIVIPSFFFMAPGAYDWLIKLALRIGSEKGALSSWLNVMLVALATIIPAAFVGYVKRSIRVFGIALAALVVAILLVHFLDGLHDEYKEWWAWWGVIAFVIALTSGFVININRVSLLNFYRDRLADCYVIKQTPSASRPVVTNDGLKLAEILPQPHAPYHLINGALNLSGSNDLSLRGRMADHFLFSKFYCGSRRLGYSPTESYADGEMDLATAMAISAAAVSPQSGQQTKAGLAVLMSLLNLRLGQWLPNPSERKQHRLVFWNDFFVKELFSLADEDDWFVFVSDGGHFENTGVFSLLQRRCKTIIAVDCGADPDRKFEDLSGLIRKARIDFGIQIEIDLSKLHGDPKTKLAESAFAVGKILYPANSQDPGGEGCFLYIKPTLSSNNSESEDLLEYSRNHPAFPQESTADQFFDEAQFESYRELGYQITKKAFTGAGDWFKNLCEQAKDRSVKGKNPLEGYKGLDRG